MKNAHPQGHGIDSGRLLEVRISGRGHKWEGDISGGEGFGHLGNARCALIYEVKIRIQNGKTQFMNYRRERHDGDTLKNIKIASAVFGLDLKSSLF